MLSTWWIKNPYLKNKLIDVRSILSWRLDHFSNRLTDPLLRMFHL